MIREAIQKVVAGQHLTERETVDAMNEIMGGRATDAQIACFITALRMKGETVEEITGAARVMREKATKIETNTLWLWIRVARVVMARTPSTFQRQRRLLSREQAYPSPNTGIGRHRANAGAPMSSKPWV